MHHQQLWCVGERRKGEGEDRERRWREGEGRERRWREGEERERRWREGEERRKRWTGEQQTTVTEAISFYYVEA